MSQLLRHKIAAVRRKRAMVDGVRGGAWLIVALLLLLAGQMLLDWLIELPWLARALLLAADAGVAGIVAYLILIRPIARGVDEEQVALSIEQRVPDFSTRLIAAVQFMRAQAIGGESSAIVRAMIAQTEHMAKPINFAHTVNTAPAARAGMLSIATLLVFAGLFAAGGQSAITLLRRAMLSNVPVPRETQIFCLTQDRTIAIGEPVTLAALADGVIPEQGTVELRYASGRRQTLALPALADYPRHFSRDIQNVLEPFTYRIHLNDAQTPWQRINAVPRPAVTEATFNVIPPAYIRQAAQQRSPGDLTVLPGARIEVTAKANKPIESAALRLIPGRREQAMTPTDPAARQFIGTIQVPDKDLSGLTIRLADAAGLASQSDTVYPVQIVPDAPPMLRLTWPDRREDTATARAKLLIAFEAADDYGLARLTLWNKHADLPDSKATPIELDLSSARDLRHLARRYELDLSRISAAEGATIEYWLAAEDGNNITGPESAQSERLRVRIVSDLEKRADLMNRLNEQLDTIELVTDDQEKLSDTLGEFIFEK